MKKFLIPVDFSETSAHTLQFVFEFNKHFFAKLDVIHLFDVPFAIADEEGQLLTGYEDYKKNFEDDLWDFINLNKGEFHYDMQVHASAGGYYQGITGFATQTGADLIIVGNRGKGKSKPFRFGSVAKFLITHPDTPVLAIPEDFNETNIKRIIVAVDLSEKIADQHFNFIKDFANRLEATLDIVHISLKNEGEVAGEDELVQQIKNQFGSQLNFIRKKEGQHVYETIQEYIKATNAQLVITFPHTHSWIDQIFLGSETKNMLAEGTVPVLSMRES